MSKNVNAREFMEGILGPITVAILFRGGRTLNDWTLKDLAEKIGVSPGFISNIENGRKQVSLSKAIEIGEFLGIPKDVTADAWLKEQARQCGVNESKIFRDETA